MTCYISFQTSQNWRIKTMRKTDDKILVTDPVSEVRSPESAGPNSIAFRIKMSKGRDMVVTTPPHIYFNITYCSLPSSKEGNQYSHPPEKRNTVLTIVSAALFWEHSLLSRLCFRIILFTDSASRTHFITETRGVSTYLSV